MKRSLVLGAVQGLAILVVIVMAVIVAYAADLFTVDKDGTVKLKVTDSALVVPNGRIGVGTENPGAQLHVVGSQLNDRTQEWGLMATFRKTFTAANNESPFVEFRKQTSNGGPYTRYGYMSVGDGGFFLVPEQSVPILLAPYGGGVGVGRTPTANVLEVEGNASKTASGSWLANSDARIKTDIRGIAGALETIDQLHPVIFRYTDEYRAKHPSIESQDYVNFIAQEFRRVFPDSVKDDGTGLLQIDIHNVTPYLVAAVQELRKENERLKARIGAMEGRENDR